MQISLSIETLEQNRLLNAQDTVHAIKNLITQEFNPTFNAIIQRHIPNITDFTNTHIDYSISNRIIGAFAQRFHWLVNNRPKIIVDFRNPIAGEHIELMLFSNFDDNVNNEYTESDDNINV
jgi:hypothetical protein